MKMDVLILRGPYVQGQSGGPTEFELANTSRLKRPQGTWGFTVITPGKELEIAVATKNASQVMLHLTRAETMALRQLLIYQA